MGTRPPPDEWPTRRSPRDDARDAAPAIFELVVVEGPDRGAKWTCDPSLPVAIGQSAACEVRLSDREVSRRHARLDVVDEAWRIRDLGSTNGTWVDGVRVIEAFLVAGTRVRIGATVLELTARPSDSAARTPAPEQRTSFGRLIGESPQMRALYPLFDRLAAARVPVLVEGEPGTGKELLAECLHELGTSTGGPFVVVALDDVAKDRAEAELFGHDDRPGAIELAHGGMLVVDELSELAPPLQARLARAVER